ncbi:MarR family transcriptional regulator [Phenylobacterium sp. J426]|uniref:MarR family winged helix-turn-helix transcriptional regulator n=1 Tax=Phenylobacterium sp. J426 TaxID=2898439 RepID=UPI0021515714|nr:MarR family transcriptional regulator [Phenylobacterium sp. J426]MCR5874525.1 MarR family transcriptional regulator [Phenylobacterium sp. J426]
MSDETAEFDPLQLDLQLCFALYSASNLVTRLYRPLLEPLGLTYPQYLAMMALWERSPQTMGELSRRLRLDSGTLQPLFTRLEGRGLVVRTRDAEDERRVLVDLTAEGQALRAEAMSVPGGAYCQLPLPHDDLVRLKAELQRLIDGLS